MRVTRQQQQPRRLPFLLRLLLRSDRQGISLGRLFPSSTKGKDFGGGVVLSCTRKEGVGEERKREREKENGREVETSCAKRVARSGSVVGSPPPSLFASSPSSSSFQPGCALICSRLCLVRFRVSAALAAPAAAAAFHRGTLCVIRLGESDRMAWKTFHPAGRFRLQFGRMIRFFAR